MAPITQASDETNHQALLDALDLFGVPKPFRALHWKPPQRRNKTVRQIISDASRREASASMMPTQNNSGSSTPVLPPPSDAASAGALTPVHGHGHHHHHHHANGAGTSGSSIAQAAQRLDRLVLERNRLAAGGLLAPPVAVAGAGAAGGGAAGASLAVTYTNIESAPSLHPSSQRRYCDVTGLPAPYTDPKTRLRYRDGEIFAVVRQMQQATTEGYLAARGAHFVLK
jgi:INO80 complex subunit C